MVVTVSGSTIDANGDPIFSGENTPGTSGSTMRFDLTNCGPFGSGGEWVATNQLGGPSGNPGGESVDLVVGSYTGPGTYPISFQSDDGLPTMRMLLHAVFLSNSETGTVTIDQGGAHAHVTADFGFVPGSSSDAPLDQDGLYDPFNVKADIYC
jgi:hypothetical protein